MRSLGWIPDIPDHRDYLMGDGSTAYQLLMAHDRKLPQLSAPVDATRYCSPVEDQGGLGSCVSQAVVGLAEYHERKKESTHVDGSRLFHYKVARSMMGWTGDTGLTIRGGMKALKAFGTPPERYWPYHIADFEKEPTSFCYAYAQRFTATKYYRVDPIGRSRDHVLSIMKSLIRSYMPIAFGFSVYSWGNANGEFPLPDAGQRPYGGHAVVAVGYDDHYRIGESVGALKIRNSWGTRWGLGGYGWLPYDYVLQGHSRDFWCLFEKTALLK